MILRLCIDLFRKFCLFSILIDSFRCIPLFEKFTKKYWFDKRELENFGENIKGIKLVQDEFRIGIISHLPEVKRYLQREMLENVARRRKNLEDQYYNGRTTQETAPFFVNQLPMHSKLLWGNSAVEEKNEVKLSEGKKGERHSNSTKTDEERSAKIRKRTVSDEVQESDYRTIINKKSMVATKVYNSKNFENCKERIRRKIDSDDDDDDDDEDDDDGGEETEDEIEDDSNIASTDANKLKSKIHISVLYKNSSYSPPFNNCNDSEEDEEEYYEDEMDNDGKNTTENLSNNKAQKKTKGIFKTNISILAIWIVGICLMVCLLTCGCFFLYIVCFDVNHKTDVPSRMPLKHFSEYLE